MEKPEKNFYLDGEILPLREMNLLDVTNMTTHLPSLLNFNDDEIYDYLLGKYIDKCPKCSTKYLPHEIIGRYCPRCSADIKKPILEKFKKNKIQAFGRKDNK